jgi:RNA polymerase sigma-70 factor (ECF subfamily)
MEISDLNKLIYLSLQGDEQAFRRIVTEFQSRIYTLCFRLMNNDEDARDAVQETFLKVWLNLHKYQNDKSFQSWIYKIAANQCLDMLRKRKKMSHSLVEDNTLIQILSEDDVEKQFMQKELGNIIIQLTEKLSPKEKIVFVLSEIEGLDVNEITEITGLSAAKIKSNLYLARQNIRNKLKNY